MSLPSSQTVSYLPANPFNPAIRLYLRHCFSKALLDRRLDRRRTCRAMTYAHAFRLGIYSDSPVFYC